MFFRTFIFAFTAVASIENYCSNEMSLILAKVLLTNQLLLADVRYKKAIIKIDGLVAITEQINR